MYVLEPALMSLHAPWKRHYHRYAALLSGYTYLEDFSKQGGPPGESQRDSKRDSRDDSSRPAYVDWRKELGHLSPFDQRPCPEDKAYTKDNFLLSTQQRQTMKLCSLSSAGLPYRRVIGMIWGADNMTQLAWLISCREGARRGAFALHGLVEKREGVIGSRNLNTIEFRHMHGSLDVQDIMNWVRVMEKVVSISIATCDESYESILQLAPSNASDIVSVLEGMGMRLSLKSAEQMAEETSTPQIYAEGDTDEPWHRQAPLMFVSKPAMGSLET
ncbi:hypothetical protein GGR52DRAFT_298476 [Hypoxylon sp. FL1284]|nr:hypothetical protein GGR52DRAFT_298476 [Hypoxylon sp. FL1284]